MPKVGDIVAAKYRIDGFIGEGGMGAVLAATHLLTSKRVALKWLRPELAADHGAIQRFMREAQAAGRIDHPNVVNVHDVGEHEGSTFLVMEMLHGESMSAAMDRGELDSRAVIQLLLPAMRGVAAAHKMGVVHRDLKPDNIFLCRGEDGSFREPKVLDFGISKMSSSDGQLNPRLTRTGAIMGTPYYMSPEQVRGLDDVDHRADIYAFGVILYEALTGRVPFDADSYGALILKIATDTPKRLREVRPELPDELDAVVLRAMAREPAQRFQDVESLARALEPFAEGLTFQVGRSDTSQPRRPGTGATPFTAEGRATVPVKGGMKSLIVAAIVVVAGGAAWALFARSSGSSSDDGRIVQPAAATATPPPSLSLPLSAVPARPAQTRTDAGAPPAPKPSVIAAPAPNPVPIAAPGPAPAARMAPTAPTNMGLPSGRIPDQASPARVREPSARPSSGRTGGLHSDEF
jgi:serine/threonine-protein kinase